MLRYPLLHPRILDALGRAGHNSKVLIADGNYPAGTKLGPRAELVSLNLSPGVVNCVQVFEAIAASIVVESAMVMKYARTGPYALKTDPPIWSEYRRILRASGVSDKLTLIEPLKFYEAAGTPDVVLTVQTAEQQIYANLLLTVGVVK